MAGRARIAKENETNRRSRVRPPSRAWRPALAWRGATPCGGRARSTTRAANVARPARADPCRPPIAQWRPCRSSAICTNGSAVRLRRRECRPQMRCGALWGAPRPRGATTARRTMADRARRSNRRSVQTPSGKVVEMADPATGVRLMSHKAARAGSSATVPPASLRAPSRASASPKRVRRCACGVTVRQDAGSVALARFRPG